MKIKKRIKVIIFCMLVCFSVQAFASQLSLEKKACHYSQRYLNAGWKIEDPQNFKSIEKKIDTILENGIKDGTIIPDMSGPILTTDTVDGEELFMTASMWDDLKTERDTMFGDIALLEVPSGERAEIRWFDGNQRNIVINPNFLTCFSEAPPYADNSVL